MWLNTDSNWTWLVLHPKLQVARFYICFPNVAPPEHFSLNHWRENSNLNPIETVPKHNCATLVPWSSSIDESYTVMSFITCISFTALTGTSNPLKHAFTGIYPSKLVLRHPQLAPSCFCHSTEEASGSSRLSSASSCAISLQPQLETSACWGRRPPDVTHDHLEKSIIRLLGNL